MPFPLVRSKLFIMQLLGCDSRARLLGDLKTWTRNLFGVKLAKGMALSRFNKYLIFFNNLNTLLNQKQNNYVQ